MPVRDMVLGSTQPVLAISLEPGESVVGPMGGFAWMTDSIQMAAGQHGLSTYTAKDAVGTIAFAARRPGRILSVEVAPERDYLVSQRGFLAGTPGIEVGTQPLGQSSVLRRIYGRGRAWLPAGGSRP